MTPTAKPGVCPGAELILPDRPQPLLANTGFKRPPDDQQPQRFLYARPHGSLRGSRRVEHEVRRTGCVDVPGEVPRACRPNPPSHQECQLSPGGDDAWRQVRPEQGIGHNTFGSTLALQYRHLFNPRTYEDRVFIAKNAYIKSRRRDRYSEPIDTVIRAAIPPSIAHAKSLKDSAHPRKSSTSSGTRSSSSVKPCCWWVVSDRARRRSSIISGKSPCRPTSGISLGYSEILKQPLSFRLHSSASSVESSSIATRPRIRLGHRLLPHDEPL